MKYLLDTNIIIYHLKDGNAAVQFIKKHADQSCISFITVIEVLSFDYTKTDRDLVKNLLESFPRLDIDESIIDTTVRLRMESKVKLPDCIIAATALTNNLVLVTKNTKDFARFRGLNITNPFNS